MEGLEAGRMKLRLNIQNQNEREVQYMVLL